MTERKNKKKRGAKLFRAFRFAFFIFAATAPQSPAAHPTESYDLGEHSLGAGFGEVILTGDFAKKYSNTLGVSGIYEYKASELFGVLADISYSKHDSDDGLNSLKIFGVTPNLKINLSYFDKLTAFVMTGFGFFNVSESIGPLYGGSVTTFGFSAGPGFDLRLNEHAKFGSLVTFHNLFSKTDPNAKNPVGKGMSIGGTYLRLFPPLPSPP